MTPDTIEVSDNPIPRAPAWQDIDPWGAAPQTASKLHGLGGSEPSQDPAFVFETAFFTVAPGPFRMRIVIDGASRTEAAFLLQVSNRSDFPGSPSVRLLLTIATLDAIVDADGVFDVTVEAEPNTQYALSAFLHTDENLHINALRILVDRPARVAAIVPNDIDRKSEAFENAHDAPSQVRDVSHLMGSELPSFTNPYSQPSTPSQQLEPAYLARCGELNLDTQLLESWTEAFVLQVLIKYGALSADRCGIGFDCGGQALPWSLLQRSTRILMTRFDDPGVEADVGAELRCLKAHAAVSALAEISFTTLVPRSLPAGYFGAFDFGWWIAPQDISVSNLTHQLGAITSALKPKGVGVLVLPFHSEKFAALTHEPSTHTVTRPIIERTALEVIAQGHSVAQLRFGSSRGMSNAARFGLIISRS